MNDYHDKIKTHRVLNGEVKLVCNAHDFKKSEFKKWLFLGLALATIQVITTIELIQARHEIRAMRGEFDSYREQFAQVADDVSEHDEMLETIGDDVTLIEQQLSALAARKRGRK